MLESFVGRVLSGTVDRLLGRAIVGGLAAVAGGFATGAAFIALDKIYGTPIACLILAGGFAALAAIGAAIVARQDGQTTTNASETEGGEAEASGEAAGLVTQITDQVARDPAMALAVASTAFGAVRSLGRNGTLLLLAALLILAVLLLRGGTLAPAEEGPSSPGA